MNLTTKDKEFLEKLSKLLDEKELAVELRTQPFKRFVLRRNYGDKIHRAFGMISPFQFPAIWKELRIWWLMEERLSISLT